MRNLGILAFLTFSTGCKSGNALPTPAWGIAGKLEVQTDSGGLLLRHESGAVYRYDARAGTLAPGTWGTGPTSDCDTQLPSPAFQITSGKLTVGGTVIALAGAVAVNTRVSPSGRLVAVISAAAAKTSGFMWALAGGGNAGPFHHQVFTPTGAPHGSATKLPFSGGTTTVLACWSPDERFVVYTDLAKTQLAVVAVTP